jgi:hypothetical protein
MKYLALIFAILGSITVSSQKIVALDSSILNSLIESTFSKGMGFCEEIYESEVNQFEKTTIDRSWYEKSYPLFFDQLDKNKKWMELISLLDQDASSISRLHKNINSFNHLPVLTADDLNNYGDSLMFDWEAYIQHSATPSGFFQTSNVAISSNENLAVIKLVGYEGALTSSAQLVLMKKRKNKWKVIAEMTLWIG